MPIRVSDWFSAGADCRYNKAMVHHPRQPPAAPSGKSNKPDTPVLPAGWIRVRVPSSNPELAEDAPHRARAQAAHWCERRAAEPRRVLDQAPRTMISWRTPARALRIAATVRTGLPGRSMPTSRTNVAEGGRQARPRHIVVTSSPATTSTTAARVTSPRPIRAYGPRRQDHYEVLTPDFLRQDGALEIVVEAAPDVFNHKPETVPLQLPRSAPGTLLPSLRLHSG